MSAVLGGKGSRRKMAGDPGLFGFLGDVASNLIPGGGVVKGALGAAKGLLKGGGGAPASKATGVSWQQAKGGAWAQQRIADLTEQLAGMRGGERKGFGLDVPMMAQGKQGVIEDPNAVSGGCPNGYHPNKSAYYRTTPGGSIVHHAKGTVCVKNRRKNPLNPRALSHSVARLVSYGKARKRIDAHMKRLARDYKPAQRTPRPRRQLGAGRGGQKLLGPGVTVIDTD